MGAYLSEPKVEKLSSDEANEFIGVGASSMQGWRTSQEDAHNCILDFDKNTSFFAVYDGHGGAEVATYCAEKLPDFLKSLSSYKSGDFEQALKDAFLGFDATLLQEDIVDVLKKLAGEKNPDNDSDMADDEEEEDIMELCRENTLPLDQVLEKYKGCAAKFHHINRLKQSEACASGPSGSKPLSPFLRGRRNQNGSGEESPVVKDGVPSCSSSSSSQQECGGSATNKTRLQSQDLDETTVSSSCGKTENAAKDGEINEASCSSATNGTVLACSSPDSSSANAAKQLDSTKVSSGTTKIIVQNGSVIDSSAHQENEISTNSSTATTTVVNKVEGVTSSSSSSVSTLASDSSVKHENGEVSSGSLAPKVKKDIDSSPVTPKLVVAKSDGASGSSAAASKISSSTTENDKKKKAGSATTHNEDDDSSSSDDADFNVAEEDEENSSTEDCEPGEEETEEENEDEETEEDEEEIMDDDDTAFCTNMIEEPGKDSGCTAVIAVLNGRDLYVANAGDSRCVVCRAGNPVEMSFDHKPEDIEESDRIFKAGGKVTLDGRVNGGLNLSRAIGDHAYKMNKDLPPEKQMISALPDIRKLVISAEDEFMILACDGIWNFLSSEEVVKFIKRKIDDGEEKMSKICESLFDYCLAPSTIGDGTGCDNMTAVIIRFSPDILKMSTKITEESETLSVSKKRCASPTGKEEEAAGENSSKRLKTDHINMVVDCDKIEMKKSTKTNDIDEECSSAQSTTDISMDQSTTTTTTT